MPKTLSNQTNSSNNTNVQIHACTLCDATYLKKGGLSTHVIRVHKITWGRYQADINGDTLLKCMLCDFSSNQLAVHIKKYHSLTTKEYWEKFPDAKISQLTQKQIEKIRETKAAKDSKNKQSLAEQKKRADEAIEEGYDVLQCQLCDKTSMGSLIFHITKKHKLSMDDYRQQFPGCKVQQNLPQHRRKLSALMQEKLADPVQREIVLSFRVPYPSQIEHWTRKGFSEDEAKIKVSEFQKEQSLKGNNPKTKALRSKKASGDNNPMSLTSIAARHNVSRREAHELTPCFGRTGEAHPMFGKKHTDEALEKISSAHHLSNPDYRSKPEIKIAEFCSQLSQITTNVPIGRWNVDVLFSEKPLIVEFFGDFWHMNPRKYDAENVHTLMNVTAQKVWNRDERKITGLKSKGYKVVVIWEADWRYDRDACEKRIKEAYDSCD